MPTTRSKSNNSKHVDTNGTNATVPAEAPGTQTNQDEHQDTVGMIEGHLSGLMRNMKTLRREITELRKRNADLEEELNNAREEVENVLQPRKGAKGRVGVRELQKKVNELKVQVRELEKTHTRDKKKIAKLHATELKRDAQELQDDAEFEIGDSAHKMRKLLRQFHDIMAATALETEEECAVCMSPMEVEKARSFPCEHTFCEDCTTKIAGDSEIVRCPSCRKETPRDELEVVQYTATTQWDALLSVATRWAKMDRGRGEDTSDEEASEVFIDDDDQSDGGDAENAGEEAPPINPLESSPEPDMNGEQTDEDGVGPASTSQTSRIIRRITSPPEDSAGPGDRDPTQAVEAERPSTPDAPLTSSQPGYLESPAAEKRKRMEELAQLRALKRHRR
ncbi:hypothetical protein NM688_g4459 [Phlebia brevispora]|uniref:Uncharacterized protein n=1 Tax=Phlebia brevispora TaxID=194682 RepID=A0ACC1T2K2_9APHY|nr:hypothetical protein NM688_g4459 [Phlebia brevispora]